MTKSPFPANGMSAGADVPLMLIRHAQRHRAARRTGRR